MAFNFIFENFFQLRFPLEKDDGFLDIVVNNCLHLLLMVALSLVSAFGIDYFTALISGQKQSNRQKFWSRLPTISVVVTLFLLLDYVGRLIWLGTWGS